MENSKINNNNKKNVSIRRVCLTIRLRFQRHQRWGCWVRPTWRLCRNVPSWLPFCAATLLRQTNKTPDDTCFLTDRTVTFSLWSSLPTNLHKCKLTHNFWVWRCGSAIVQKVNNIKRHSDTALKKWRQFGLEYVVSMWILLQYIFLIEAEEAGGWSHISCKSSIPQRHRTFQWLASMQLPNQVK